MSHNPFAHLLIFAFYGLAAMLLCAGATVMMLLALKFVFLGALAKRSAKSSTAQLLATLIERLFDRKPAPAGFYAVAPLTASEQAMYRRLVVALPDHIILAEVAFSQFLKHDNYGKYGTMRQKVADFLVCDSTFKILSIIELDDPSHDRKKDADDERDARSASAGLRTIRWHVSKMPDSAEIRSRVLTAPDNN